MGGLNPIGLKRELQGIGNPAPPDDGVATPFALVIPGIVLLHALDTVPPRGPRASVPELLPDLVAASLKQPGGEKA